MDRSNAIEPGSRSADGDAKSPDRSSDGERRSGTRHETSYNTALNLGSIRYIVEVANLSADGIQICVRQGLMPAVGQLVTLHFMNGMTKDGRIVWSDGQNAGAKFGETFAEYLDVLHFDDLGADFFRAVLNFQSAAS